MLYNVDNLILIFGKSKLKQKGDIFHQGFKNFRKLKSLTLDVSNNYLKDDFC